MPDRDVTPQLLMQIRELIKLERNEICCKLRDLIDATDEGPTAANDVSTGFLILSSDGASFTLNPSLNYRSVSVSFISAGAGGGTVTITGTTGSATLDVAGYSTTFSIDKGSDLGVKGLVVTSHATAKVYISYTYTS